VVYLQYCVPSGSILIRASDASLAVSVHGTVIGQPLSRRVIASLGAHSELMAYPTKKILAGTLLFCDH